MRVPFLLFADDQGTIYSHPFLRMTAQCSDTYIVPAPDELVTLPEGSTLFYLPRRFPVGMDPRTKKVEVLTEYAGRPVHAVSAFLIPAFLRLYHPAFSLDTRARFEKLPLWAYTACGSYGGRTYVTALRVDRRVRQSPRFYDNRLLKRQVRRFLKKYPSNRLIQHLAHCALNYNCLAAKNLFFERWEAPLPTSPGCNARCIGCLSYQKDGCVSSHDRIGFTPTPDEIVQVAVPHLKIAREALVSFGQGCEGEPLMQASVIEKAVRKIRNVTSRGTLHMNTNASLPGAIETLCRAGVDSFRVSLNSTRPFYYRRYFRPRGYDFVDVIRSIRIAKKYGKFVAVNLLAFPGFTDQDDEAKSLFSFLKATAVDMVQFRNLNIDPAVYFTCCGPLRNYRGIKKLITQVRRKFPALKIGYFNLPKEIFRTF
ncbi:MAG: radical SAM protein [Candidatus Omnitrophica bacterium]|nr:radical SAM protein [Candidatus Omnitrophota bacterium]